MCFSSHYLLLSISKFQGYFVVLQKIESSGLSTEPMSLIENYNFFVKSMFMNHNDFTKNLCGRKIPKFRHCAFSRNFSSFSDPGYGQMMTKQVTSQKSAFDLIKTSLYDEMEGSGQDDFDLASIQPTKVTEMVKETRLPELVRTLL